MFIIITIVLYHQVYIQFMRSARRTGGVKAARIVFKRAREDPRCTWQVGELLEWYRTGLTNRYDVDLCCCSFDGIQLQPGKG